MQYINRNYYIYKCKPREFNEVNVNDNALMFTDSAGAQSYTDSLRPEHLLSEEITRTAGAQSYTDALQSDHLLGEGIVKTGEALYACMSYDKRHIITIITNGADSEVINIIFRSDDEYRAALRLMAAHRLEVSPQDSKLISYARSISAKVRIGTEVRVFDAQLEDDFVVCPACGVKNPKDSGMPFCLECGEPF